METNIKNKLVNSLINSQNQTFTENGMITNSTSGNDCLNFFFKIGAARNLNKSEVIELFNKSYNSNIDVTLKILMWCRDIRGGAGERMVFRYLLNELHEINPNIFANPVNLTKIINVGRWDDLFEMAEYDSNVLNFIVENVKNWDDMPSLLAKWFPRDQKHPMFKLVRKALNINAQELRKRVSQHTMVVEQLMCANNWNDINYEHVPSKAAMIYKKAFKKHDEDRYNIYLQEVEDGVKKINASTLFPYEIVRDYHASGYGFKSELDKTLELQWKNLPNYLQNNKERIIPVCDISGSMFSSSASMLPIDVSISLGIYISERNEGIFKNFLISFSESPKYFQLDGENLLEKINKLSNIGGYNTDIELVFDELLNVAKINEIKNEEMPTALLIISDMEFDQVRGRKNKNVVEMIKDKYSKNGYDMPKIYFWNVNSRQVGNIPVTITDEGVFLISGASPSILESVLNGNISNPIEMMLNVVNKDKYQLNY